VSPRRTSHFCTSLLQELMDCLDNWHGEDNWDFVRFGPVRRSRIDSITHKLMNLLTRKGIAIWPRHLNLQVKTALSQLKGHMEGLGRVYDLLEDEASKLMLVKVVAYRIMGFRKVKLPLNNPSYWSMRNLVTSLANKNDTVKTRFLNCRLNRYQLDKIGIPLDLYSGVPAITSLFVLKQYEYNKTTSPIKAQYGDYVIDAGGGWGDTALYFAREVGSEGKVFTFEFMPSNLDAMLRNFYLSASLKRRIEIIRKALWCESGLSLFFVDKGPASRARTEPTGDLDLSVKALSIDDFVRKRGLPRVDFIKMDIEGAELKALKGAVRTIKRHRPRVAISLYHSLDDLVEIPQFLSSFNLGYKFYLDHFTIHREETILFGVSE